MVRSGILGWVAFGLLLTFGILQARSTSAALKILRDENAALADTMSARSDTIADLKVRVAAADSAVDVVIIETSEEIESADDAAVAPVRNFRQLIAGNPVLEAGFDSVQAGHAVQLAARDSALVRRDRKWTLARAELRLEKEALERQLVDKDKSIANLEEQVRTATGGFNLFGIKTRCVAGVGVTTGSGTSAGLSVACGVGL